MPSAGCERHAPIRGPPHSPIKMPSVLRDDSPTDLRSNSDAPLYVSLARILTEAISGGRHPVGALLPTEETLAQAYAVSRQTVREALRLLEEQGLVSRRRGIGTRVLGATPHRRYTVEIESVNDIVELINQVRFKVISITPVSVAGRLAERLGCREGSLWLEVRGTRCRADCPQPPVAVMECYLREGYDGIEQALHDIGETAIHRLLEQRYGEQIDEIRQVISAVAITPEDAEQLNVLAHSPGLKVDRRFTGRGGRLVMAGHLIYPGEIFSYAGSFRRDRSD